MDKPFSRCVDFLSAYRSSLLLLLVTIVVAALVLHSRALSLRHATLSHFPRSPAQQGIYLKRVLQYVYHAEALYMAGYLEFKTIFRLTTTQGECLVIPVDVMHELRNRPDNELDAGRAINTMIGSAHTGIDVRNTLGGEALARTLSRRLPYVCSLLWPEVDRAIESALRPWRVNGASWTALAPFDFISRAIFMSSGFLFVGPELGRSMDYLDANVGYVADLFAAARAISAWPAALRRAASLPLINPAMARIKRRETRLKKLLMPVIEERKRGERGRKRERERVGEKASAANLKRNRQLRIQGGTREQNQEENWDEDEEDGTDKEDKEDKEGGGEKLEEMEEHLPYDLLQLMIAKHDSQPDGPMTDADLGRLTQGMLLNTGGILSSCCVSTQILYHLVAHPEVIPDLRAEISSALLAHNGIMSAKALARMELLDSAMAESFRMTPLLMTRFNRYVPHLITLQDGTTIPAGTSIEVPSFCVAHDPALYPNPDVYDPYRFYRLRAAAASHDGTPGPGREREGENHSNSDSKDRKIDLPTVDLFQFVTVNKQSLGWGYGRHTCPGRHFAGMLIKLVLVRVLLDYDLSMAAEEAARPAKYAPVKLAGTIFPDLGKRVLMKRRSGEKIFPT